MCRIGREVLLVRIGQYGITWPTRLAVVAAAASGSSSRLGGRKYDKLSFCRRRP